MISFRSRLALLAATALFPHLAAHAQTGTDWPARPVLLINPFAAGSAVDVVARLRSLLIEHEAVAGLRVADLAVFVISAVDGVEVQTEKVWAYAEEYKLPRIIVINRIDRDRASFARTLESLGFTADNSTPAVTAADATPAVR